MRGWKVGAAVVSEPGFFVGTGGGVIRREPRKIRNLSGFFECFFQPKKTRLMTNRTHPPPAPLGTAKYLGKFGGRGVCGSQLLFRPGRRLQTIHEPRRGSVGPLKVLAVGIFFSMNYKCFQPVQPPPLLRVRTVLFPHFKATHSPKHYPWNVGMILKPPIDPMKQWMNEPNPEDGGMGCRP